jgi:hypothetical protein
MSRLTLVQLGFAIAALQCAFFLYSSSPPGKSSDEIVEVSCPYTFCTAPTIAVPSTFHVRFTVVFADGEKDSFDVAVHEQWAPQGALHFWQLVQDRFFDNSLVFRVLPWMAQFGLNNYPMNKKWITVRVLSIVVA